MKLIQGAGLNLLIFFICIHTNSCKPKKNGNGGGTYKEMLRIFNIDQQKVRTHFESNYNLNSLKLLHPSSMEKAKEKHRGVFTVETKRGKTMALKFELESGVRSVFNERTGKVACHGIESKEDIPTEEKINLLMKDRQFFIGYKTSNTFVPEDAKKPKIKMHVNVYLTGSMDLDAFAEQNRKLLKTKYLKNLKRIFTGIWLALDQLLKEGYLYTDLKPENILIGQNGEPYLIDLESVINTNDNRVCISTSIYFPPAHDKRGNHMQVLTWGFCYTVYDAICNANHKKNKAMLDTMKWGSNFLGTFKCDVGSEEIKVFLNKCLVKKRSLQVSFNDLKKGWLSESIAKIQNKNMPMPQ